MTSIGIESRVFGWTLRRMREGKGWSRRELAEKAGLSAGVVGAYESLKSWPSPDSQRAIASALGTHPEVLFPQELRETMARLHHRRIETQVSVEALPFSDQPLLTTADLPSERSKLSQEALRVGIESALDSLKPREREVLLLHDYAADNPLTFEQIGNRWGVTRERVRQVREKALRKMRHPTRSKHLKPYVGDDDENRPIAESRGGWEPGHFDGCRGVGGNRWRQEGWTPSANWCLLSPKCRCWCHGSDGL